MLTKNEKLALAYAAFKTQIKSATAVLETRFKAPLADWVDGLKNRVREVDGKVKIFRPRIEEVPATTALDEDRVAQDFRKALLEGKFNQAELLKLIEDGLLVPAIDTERAIEKLREKGGKARSAYTVRVPKQPASWRQELRDLPLAKGAYEGLAASLRSSVDLEGTIVRTADAIEELPLEVFSGRRSDQVELGARGGAGRRR